MRLRKKDGTSPLHVCRCTIEVVTRVNDGPPSQCGRFTVTEGTILTIMQPVEVTFRAQRPERYYPTHD